MMCMPTVEELEKLSYKELLAERKRIMQYITEFEEDYDMRNLDWECHPMPDARYQSYLDFLGILCTIISKKFNEEYIWGTKNVTDYYDMKKNVNE